MNQAQPVDNPQTAEGVQTLATPQSRYTSYFRYDSKALRLEVGFKDGRVVEHWPIYPQTFLDLQCAPSKGSFYFHAIKKTTNASPIRK